MASELDAPRQPPVTEHFLWIAALGVLEQLQSHLQVTQYSGA